MIEIKLYTSFFELLFCRAFVIFNLKDQQKKKRKKITAKWSLYSLLFSFLFLHLHSSLRQGDWWWIAGTFDSGSLQQEYHRPSCKLFLFSFSVFTWKKNENEGKNRKKDASACGIFFSLFILFFTYLDLDLKLLDLPVSSSRSMKLFLVAWLQKKISRPEEQHTFCIFSTPPDASWLSLKMKQQTKYHLWFAWPVYYFQLFISLGCPRPKAKSLSIHVRICRSIHSMYHFR